MSNGALLPMAPPAGALASPDMAAVLLPSLTVAAEDRTAPFLEFFAAAICNPPGTARVFSAKAFPRWVASRRDRAGEHRSHGAGAPRLRRACATVPRERFVRPGPWRVRSSMGRADYWTTDDPIRAMSTTTC